RPGIVDPQEAEQIGPCLDALDLELARRKLPCPQDASVKDGGSVDPRREAVLPALDLESEAGDPIETVEALRPGPSRSAGERQDRGHDRGGRGRRAAEARADRKPGLDPQAGALVQPAARAGLQIDLFRCLAEGDFDNVGRILAAHLLERRGHRVLGVAGPALAGGGGVGAELLPGGRLQMVEAWKVQADLPTDLMMRKRREAGGEAEDNLR